MHEKAVGGGGAGAPTDSAEEPGQAPANTIINTAHVRRDFMIMNAHSAGPAPAILHIITRLDAGGAVNSTLTSIDRLRKYNLSMALAYGRTADPDRTIRGTIEALNIPLFSVPALVRAPSPVRDLTALFQLMRIIRAGSYALVHTHTSKAGVLGRLAARLCGVPVVHTPHGHIFYGYFGAAMTAVYVAIERGLAKFTAKIVSLTDDETAESLRRHIGRPEQYVTIPSGVPLSGFRELPAALGAAFRAGQGIPPDAFLIVSVGRLTPIKGFDILLRAFADARFAAGGAFLAIVGEGEERERLELLSRASGIAGRVRFVGALRDVRGALRAADAFVLASRNEGMGRALIEAMAAGLPAIGAAVGGIRTVIRDRENGLLVPPENPAALADALALLAGRTELRAALGRKAAGTVYPAYDENTMVESLAALYKEILHP